MSIPTTSVAPAAPTTSSPLRSIASFIEWLGHPRTWITGLSPAGSTVYDTGWQAITPNAGFTGAENLAWRRKGKDIKLRGQITRNAGVFPSSHEAVFTLPDEAKPDSYERWPVAVYSSPLPRGAVATIGTDGICSIGGLGDSTDTVRLSSIIFWKN